ncbi:UvrD-helicase domain-containing protein [Streptosporangium sp. V21-05]|uniref:UvrD-helicase domain-containing protein n=1 Tax=Streptosporangium sp. V21-05 TaxID=3446115 RepID=UPI003F52B94F
MSNAYSATPQLTPEQQVVVDQPADVLVMVTAGAGAGKTHTLVRRLERLVAEEDLSAGEILVLTFSRAAVRELSGRLARYGEAARHVRARTFDSWALELLTQVDAAGDWPNRSFEARINGARQAVEDGLADNLYEDLRHVVIDEVQDLVGDRRELVEVLLERFDCGFTVVGDPAQSIYGFTVKNVDQRKGETNRFFDWLRATFQEDLVELALTENFRARSDEARTALGYGVRLRSLAEAGGADDRPLYEELRLALKRNLDMGELDQDFAATALGDYEGTTAVLCRTNGQALVISEMLHRIGVSHRVQRSARDRVVPAWIGLLLRRSEWSMLGRSRFDALLANLPVPEGTSSDVLWRLLHGSGRGLGNSLDLGRVRTAIAAGRLPDELTAQPPTRLTVSSFHRAKGLEFDRVLIVDPGPLPSVKEAKKAKRVIDAAEETRLLYVAMTRPRDELYRLESLNMRNIRVDKDTKRWGRYFYQHWARKGVEIVGGDVRTAQPAGTWDFTTDPGEVQDYLSTKVQVGDEVVLERSQPDAVGLQESPPYLVMHGGRPIGTTSERFHGQLYRHLKLGSGYEPRNWPRMITGIRIDAVETVAGSEAAGANAGLGPYGVWLAPRLFGLGHFIWDRIDQEEGISVEAR